MRKYLDHAIIWDLLFCFLLGTGLLLSKHYIGQHLSVPTPEKIDKLGDCLVTIGTTLIGILLTIITVIVTFKKGFEDAERAPTPKDTSVIPESTIFDTKISKEVQFYSTNLHKKVVDVFVGATYETSINLLILLGVKTNLFALPNSTICLLTFSAFIMLSACAIRSFYIFRLFLQVHLH
jgi:hypothetical protein